MKFLIQFAHIHLEFRIPELESILVAENIKASFDAASFDNEQTFLEIEFDSEEDAKKVASRAILIKSIFKFWAAGADLLQVRDKVFNIVQSEGLNDNGESWKFDIVYFGNSKPSSKSVEKFELFLFIGERKGKIDMKNAEVIYTIIEDYGHDKGNKIPLRVFFGIWLCDGNRSAVQKYNLKKRVYLGTTSMDAELSLIMGNMALAGPGKLIYDPFVGTGSFLVTCAHYGSYTMGSDIDQCVMKGRVKLNPGTEGIRSVVDQYDLGKQVLGTLTIDNSRMPFRKVELFDAIVTDPPYGVRAGAKKIGDGQKPYFSFIPTTVCYEMEDIILDLINFAAAFLKPKGRLVFWLPTITEEYTIEQIPSHPLLKIIANSSQDFGRWERRLITMEKVSSNESFTEATKGDEAGHAHFRMKYFATASEAKKHKELRGN